MSHFGSHRRTGMLACTGPSRPHTCVSGSPGRGGWGGQRSPLWATATGPGLFRSLGFKNPSGYWLFGGQHTAIQRVGRLGGAEAPACVVCVFACAVVPCAKFQHFCQGGGGWLMMRGEGFNLWHGSTPNWLYNVHGTYCAINMWNTFWGIKQWHEITKNVGPSVVHKSLVFGKHRRAGEVLRKGTKRTYGKTCGASIKCNGQNLVHRTSRCMVCFPLLLAV